VSACLKGFVTVIF